MEGEFLKGIKMFSPTQIINANLELSDFEYFCTQIFERAGISMSSSKLSLVQSRLRPRLAQLKLKNYSDYRKHLEKINDNDPEWEAFTNVLTTNKTEWFRESDHFDYLENVFLPKWKTLEKKELNIWCAACSTGEEAYTIALVLEGHGIKYKIKASDIDTKVLKRAQGGVFQRHDLSQIPEEYHHNFIPGTGDISDWMKIRDHIKANISFQQINLNDTPYTFDKSFDLIFCRNVMIYFKQPMIQKVTTELFKVADQDSMLFIAHSESLQNINTPWSYVAPSIYRKGRHF